MSYKNKYSFDNLGNKRKNLYQNYTYINLSSSNTSEDSINFMTDKNKISEEESKKKNMENNPEIYF